MINFYLGLKSVNTLDFIRDNVDLFDMLSDQEIMQLFNDEEIDENLKRYLMSECSLRLNKLSSSSFAQLVQFIGDGNLLLDNYLEKVNSFSCGDLVTIIYDTYCEPDCLYKILGSKRFEELLNEEIKDDSGTYLQTFSVCAAMTLTNDKSLEEIASKIDDILNKKESILEYSAEMEYIVGEFFPLVVSGIKDIDINSNIFSVCFKLMGYNFKCHRMIDSKMVEFYTLFRLKELGLDSICKNVVVDNSSVSNIFGYFQGSDETMKIYYNYISNRFLPIINDYGKEFLGAGTDLMNLTFLQWISHEIGHVSDLQKVTDIQKNQADNLNYMLEADSFMNYWWRNGLVRVASGEDCYHDDHGSFIRESRADIFAILDFGGQLDRRFSQYFPERALEGFSATSAERLVKMYTEDRDDKKFIKSPMKKFDDFFAKHSTEIFDISKVVHLKNDNSQNVLRNLLLGDAVPKDLIVMLHGIAKGSKRTPSIYKEIVSYIANFSVKVPEEELDIKKM